MLDAGMQLFSSRFLWLESMLGRRHHLIWAFHRVRPSGQPRDRFDSCPSVSVDALRTLLQYVKNRFEVVHLSNLFKLRNDSKPLAAITFDDGWRDNFDLAFPLLVELQIPATVFITTGKIGSCQPFWQQCLGSVFRAASMKQRLATLFD